MLAVAGLGSSQALADPPQNEYRALSGVGSDTTQDVLNGLAEAVTVNGQKVIGSYDAIGSSTIQTKSNAACAGITRPNGSGAGRTALINSLVANNGCVDFARSSSETLTAAPVQLTYVPFATDAVTFAVTGNSGIPRNLTLDELRSVYKCEVEGINPYIPQAGSGTRSFWLGQMQITEAQIAQGLYPCLRDRKNGQPIQEHNGTYFGPDDIVPFSVAQYISQSTAVIPDIRGSLLLGTINGASPVTLNGNFTVTRPVFNVIPTSRENTAPWSTVFVGSNSLVCQQAATIVRYGFATRADCGSTTRRTATSSPR
ncbi:hypothetical protein G9H72_18435 [Motilibacter sp. K478]|nr:substrate-binding domain-containing protein [Motilibacter aurantiacus]NHC47229.1 hypothetical protein [Motilibacter aurantiacus]